MVEPAQKQKPLPDHIIWCLKPRMWFCSHKMKLWPHHLNCCLTQAGRAAAVCHITPWGARQSHQMGCSSHSHRGGIILPAWPIRTDWNLLYTGKQNKSQQVITKLSREKSLPHTTYGNWFTSVSIKLKNKIDLYLHSLLKILHNALQSLYSSQEEFVLSKL